MPRTARNYKYDVNNYAYGRSAVQTYPNYRINSLPKKQVQKTKLRRVKVKKKTNPVQTLVKLCAALLLGGIILPYSYSHIIESNFINPIKYRNIKPDYSKLLTPTYTYLNNSYLLNKPIRVSTDDVKPLMQSLFEADRMTMLETRLHQLMNNYKNIHPSIYVWEYENGKFANINGDELFPTASIIKIPVLIEMFRAIEAKQFKLYDKMVMGEHYRTSGSGSLQFMAGDSAFNMDFLARHMIEESDNTSTNMIMAKIGGKHSVNRAIKNWGMEKTHIENWLPDLGGGNVSTAREISTMLYNINNESLLNINSRENIIDYMSHVKNNRLIQAGLPSDAQFIHKTGDIGTMLGDAGIVYAPNGQRYIVTILAKRPYNSYQGKEFIVEASKIIYDYIVNQKI